MDEPAGTTDAEEKATVSGTASADLVDVTLLSMLAALALLFGRRIHLKVGIASKFSCRIFFVLDVEGTTNCRTDIDRNSNVSQNIGNFMVPIPNKEEMMKRCDGRELVP